MWVQAMWVTQGRENLVPKRARIMNRCWLKLIARVLQGLEIGPDSGARLAKETEKVFPNTMAATGMSL